MTLVNHSSNYFKEQISTLSGIMVAIFIILIISVYVSIVSSDNSDILPPIFKMEDYTTCINKNDAYCKIDVKLINNGMEDNSIWSLIHDSISDINRYDRSIVHRAICIPKNETFNLELIKNFSKLYINKELNGTNLLGSIEDVICTYKDGVKMSSYDKLLLLFCTAYISLILYATVKDIQGKTCMDGGTENKVISSLSITSNWRKVCSTEGNEDYNRLKSIQGIRFYNMLLIISFHTLFSFTVSDLSNPNELEKEYRTVLIQIISTMGVFLVHTFFLISSWMVTYQIYNIYKDHGKFTLKHALILIINRFFRTGVCSAVAMLLMRSSLCQLFRGPLTFDGIYMSQEACKRNWWQCLFFINNYLYPGNMCIPMLWYLSVDFQLYVMATITIYLILKFKLSEWKVISFLIIFALILNGSVPYFKKMDMIMKLDINTGRKYIYIRSDYIRILYNSTYSNWTTSLVGILLGVIYTKNKYRNFTNSNFVSVLWCSIFFGLPSLMIYIANYTFKGIQAAILSCLLRALFSLGIGIGILGMSHNIGGIIKRICENKYVVLLSNFSFCTYVFQSFVVFSKGVGTYSLMEFNRTKMIKYFLFFDAPVSIIVGIMCAVIIEQPASNLQKIFLPKIARRKQILQKSQ